MNGDIAPEKPSPGFPQPPIVTRTEWGCPDGQFNARGTLHYTAVTHLIVHHTATSNEAGEAGDWSAFVRSIWNFHVFTNGWSDVGYNWLIDPHGVVYEGRAGGDNVQGAHFICANAGTMGVALLGSFTDEAPGERALSSLCRLLAWKCAGRGIDPLGASWHEGTRLELMNISGHCDGNHAPPDSGACPAGTECPGGVFYALLPRIRREVGQLLI